MIKAIIFDMDDTLYLEEEYVKSGFRKVSEFMSKKFQTQISFEDVYEEYLLDKKNVFNRVLDKKEMSYTTGDILEIVSMYKNHKPNIHLSEDVINVLDTFKNQYSLGLITDGMVLQQKQKIKALDLERFLDKIIITDELGGVQYRKPNPIAFKMMQEFFGIEFNEMMYVADNPQKDFVIKELYNITTVQVLQGMYTECHYFKNIKPDYKINNLNELINVIEFEKKKDKRMEKRIFLSSPTMHGEEQLFIKEAFDTNWVAPLGKNVDEFEKGMAEYVGVKASTALVSGTSALHLAVKLAGVEQGNIVLCSDLTFAATVNPVAYEKGTLVFVDSERDTWNMDPVALEKALIKYEGKAKAVIVAHLYGTPSKMDEIKALCEKYNVVLIEDAAESLGATYKGKQTGSFGKYAGISFNGNKIITSSGGGMLLSDDVEAVKKARFWATQSREPYPWYQHNEIGYNYRMSNIVAGIGRGQLLHLDEHIALKKAIYLRYQDGLKDLPVKMNPYMDSMEPNFWLSCLIIDKETIAKGVTPEKIRLALDSENIEARPIWKPMHMQPVFEGCDFVKAYNECVSEDIFARGLCLPSDIKMTIEEQNEVIRIIREQFNV